MINERYAHEFCKDDITKIENYDKAIADPTQTWDIHHRLELTLDGEFAHSREELIRLGMYYNRPYFELIFLTHGEHSILHKKGKGLKGENHPMYGRHHSEATRKKMSEAQKGENHPLYGQHHSVKTRQKMAEAHKGKHHSDEHRQKITEAMKGKHHSEETRKKMSEAAKRRWLREGI